MHREQHIGRYKAEDELNWTFLIRLLYQISLSRWSPPLQS